jgi:hypothetical protein
VRLTRYNEPAHVGSLGGLQAISNEFSSLIRLASFDVKTVCATSLPPEQTGSAPCGYMIGNVGRQQRHQSACDGFECPDWIRRQGCVVSAVCGGDVVPSIA